MEQGQIALIVTLCGLIIQIGFLLQKNFVDKAGINSKKTGQVIEGFQKLLDSTNVRMDEMEENLTDEKTLRRELSRRLGEEQEARRVLEDTIADMKNNDKLLRAYIMRLIVLLRKNDIEPPEPPEQLQILGDLGL